MTALAKVQQGPALDDPAYRLERLNALSRSAWSLVGQLQEALNDPVIRRHGPTAMLIDGARQQISHGFGKLAAASFASRFEMEEG